MNSFSRHLSRSLPTASKCSRQALGTSQRFQLARSMLVANPAPTKIQKCSLSTSKVNSATPSDTLPIPQSRSELGQILEVAKKALEENDPEVALKHYFKAKEFDPSNSGSHLYNIGICHYQLGQVDKAISSWEESLEVDPNQPDTLVNLANVYIIAKKNATKALEHFEKALKLSPDDGEIAYNYACTLEAIGKLDEAAKNYQIAHKSGIEKAATNLRNVLVKLVSKNKN